MIQNTLRIASLLALGLTSALTSLLQAQLSVSGTVTSYMNTPQRVEIVVYQGNTQMDMLQPKRRGQYATTLECGHVYTLEFREQGAVTKRVTLDTRTETLSQAADSNDRIKGRCDLDMKMLQTTPEIAANLDFEFPVAILKWHDDGAFGPERNYIRVAGMTYDEARLVGVVR